MATKTEYEESQPAPSLGETTGNDSGVTAREDYESLLHELHARLTELELENEQLRRRESGLTESRDRYSDLYEFAPLGYLTLDKEGSILEANLAAATMLGGEQAELPGAKMSDFVARGDQEVYRRHLQAVLAGDTRQTCEIAMHKPDGTLLWGRLESAALQDRSGNRDQLRTALIEITDRMGAQCELQESEQRYRRLTESVTDYIFTVRIEKGRPIETVHGENCVAVTGYTPQEFAANPMLWIVMVPPEDRDLVTRQVARVLSGDDVEPIEHRIRRKDGSVRWVSSTAVPHRDTRGRLLAYDGLLRDITERKTAEETIRRLNAELEQRVAERTAEVEQRVKEVTMLVEAVSNLSEGLLITDDHHDWPGSRIVFVNEAMCRITGYAADELIGQTPSFLQGEQVDRKTRAWVKRQLAEDKPCTCEVVGCRKDGTMYDAELFITPLLDCEGRRSHFVSIHRDITERKRAEEALRKSQERFDLAVRGSADGIWDWTDVTRGELWWSPRFYELLGYQPGEIEPRISTIKGIIHPDDLQRVRKALRTHFEKRIRYDVEYRLRTKSGKYRWFRARAVVLRDSSGQPTRMTGCIEDIQERKTLEREILEIAATEQRRIGQDLHDGIGQELTGLGMVAEGLVELFDARGATTRKDAGMKDLRDTARQLSDGIGRTTAHVRELSHGLVPVDVDAQGLMSALEELVSSTGAVHEVSCTFDYRHPVALSDNFTATHLYRIAQEAIGNALKHGKAKRIRVALSDDGGQVELAVTDNGVGLDDAAAPNEGRGLRIMAYCAGLIGATLKVEPARGGGTSVTCAIANHRQVSRNRESARSAD